MTYHHRRRPSTASPHITRHRLFSMPAIAYVVKAAALDRHHRTFQSAPDGWISSKTHGQDCKQGMSLSRQRVTGSDQQVAD